ncbi:MAG: 4Fe-4S dicluster domain-containing protein, partial [Desulfobacteraceae bacterium]
MTIRKASIGHEIPSCNAVSDETIARLKKGDISVLIPLDKNIKAVPKVIAVDPQKCNGCRLCETACSLFHKGETDPALSRIRIIEWDIKGVFLPVLCQHCADAPCGKACPKDAISWNDDWGRVTIDYNRCVSCRMCEAACPYGAIRFD